MKLLINEGFVDYYFVLLLMFVFKQKFDYIKGKISFKIWQCIYSLNKNTTIPRIIILLFHKIIKIMNFIFWGVGRGMRLMWLEEGMLHFELWTINYILAMWYTT